MFLKLKFYRVFLLFCFLSVANASDQVKKNDELLGSWRIESIHSDIRTVKLEACDMGSVDIRQYATSATVSIHSCFNNEYVKRCRVPSGDGVLNEIDSSTYGQEELCNIVIGGGGSNCSEWTECNDVKWHCRYLKLGEAACQALYDKCTSDAQFCEGQRQEALNETEKKVLYDVSNYTVDGDNLTLLNDSGGIVRLKRAPLPLELEAEKDRYESKRALSAMQPKKPSHFRTFDEETSLNRLQITYLPKETIYDPKYQIWEDHRNDYDIATEQGFDPELSGLVACPELIDWHPSQAITGQTYTNGFKWLWRRHKLQDGNYCLVMLSPLLGPLGEQSLNAFTSGDDARIRQWLHEILPAKQYELHSSSSEVICLPSNGLAWWDKGKDFFTAGKFVFEDIKLIDSTIADIDNKLPQASIRRRLAAQKVNQYLTEHAQAWTDIWSDISDSDIRVSDHIEGYFEVADKYNSRIIHLVNSKTVPAQLNDRTLKWYMGYFVLDQYTKSVITEFIFRVDQPGWVIDYSIPMLNDDWMLTLYEALHRFARQDVKSLFHPCT